MSKTKRNLNKKAMKHWAKISTPKKQIKSSQQENSLKIILMS